MGGLPQRTTSQSSAWGELEEHQGAAGHRADCVHCGLSVTPGGPQGRFCCSGCESVYAILSGGMGAELREFEQVCDMAGARPNAARASGRSYEEFDDPTFLELYAGPARGGASIRLYVQGLHCGACLWLIERVTSRMEGVLEARVDLSRSLLLLTWDPGRTPLSAIARAVDGCGYPLHAYRGGDRAELHKLEDRALLTRIGIAGAAAGNVMLMAFALYSGAFSGMEDEYRSLFHWGSLLIAVPAVLYSGQEFFRGAWAAIRTRTPHIDLPVALGIAVGLASGVANTVLGRSDVYFDSLTVLVFALLVGRYLQQRQRRAAASSAEMLFSLSAGTAHVVGAGPDVEPAAESIRTVPIESVQVGDILEVRPGETVPADGVLLTGRTSIDASLLTGESRPVAAAAGTELHAGTVNLSGTIRMTAQKAGEQTRMSALLGLVEEAARRRAPVVALADRVAGWFVVSVLGVALVASAVWAFIDPSRVVDVVVALLVVTCPCALGMATPLAVSVAVGRAARQHILVKGGEVLERLAKPGTIYFDKTGTLTEGRMRVVETRGPERMWPVVARLEAHSAHPVASAIREHVGRPDDGAPADQVNVLHTTGGGVAAEIDGRQVAVGTERFLREQGATVGPVWVALAQSWAERGFTPVMVAESGSVLGAIACGDRLRESSPGAIESLRQAGFQIRVLSGDHPAAVRETARQLGLRDDEIEGAATPERKLAVVEASVSAGIHTFFVGDGVNDAAALSAASVGIAVHGGAEASMNAASVYLADEGLTPVLRAIEGSQRTLAVIRRNIGFSLVYNVIGASLALTGVLTPLWAAVLMPISSLTVLASSSRARTFQSA